MNTVPIFQTEENLPSQLGELNYAGSEVYDDPRLGAKIRYEFGITKADLYLYDLGMAEIPADIDDPLVTEVYRQSCGEVLTLAEAGLYLDFELRKSEYLNLGMEGFKPSFLWAAFRYRQAPGQFTVSEEFRYSHIFLRTNGGYFNKVRYTYPESEAANSSERMIHFLIEWLKVISANVPPA
jgi:hypothetical protein